MIRKAVKWSLITAAAVVVMGVLVGPERVTNLAATAHAHVVDNVDTMIAPEVKLSNEIRALEREYPKQLAELRTQLRDVERALKEVADESTVATKVVKLCDADLADLQPRVTVTALEVGEENVATRTLSQRLQHVLRTRDAYASRAAMAVEEQVVLAAERNRIAAELASLEQEARDFHAQVAVLEREIESIARNDALIKIAKQRRACEERRIDRRAATALDRLHSEIQERRAEQAEILTELQATETSEEYEARARILLERPAAPTTPPASREQATVGDHRMF